MVDLHLRGSNMTDISNLPTIARSACTASGSDNMETSEVIDRTERCFVTNSVLHTHEPTRWIRVSARKKLEMEQYFMTDLHIVDDCIDLDGPANIAFLDPVISGSLDDSIAITLTLETLKELKKMVEEGNAKRQSHLDQHGEHLPRYLDLNNPSFLDPKYELVALRPEDFSPTKRTLIRYDPAEGTHKTYVPSPDRRLRESPGDLTCPPFPSFSGPARQPGAGVNPFLVVLRAESTFRCFFNRLPPRRPLPKDVLDLMRETLKLFELIYWEPGKTQWIPWPYMASDWGSEAHYELQKRVETGHALLSGHDLELTPEEDRFVKALHSGNL